jgi:hypothetical protein
VATTFSARRLSDATLKKYQDKLARGEQLTSREKANLEAHHRMVAFSRSMDDAARQGMRGTDAISFAIHDSTAKQN